MDVSALLTDTGDLIQWVKYSAYGVPFMIPSGDLDSDGDFDVSDAGGLGDGTVNDVREDVNLDGVSDVNDLLDALDLHNAGTFGWGVLSADQTANRRGYAGYEHDPVTAAAGRHLCHVRHRVYEAELGRWMRRDPLGYIHGLGLHIYVDSQPLAFTDPSGLCGRSCTPPAEPKSWPTWTQADCIDAVNKLINEDPWIQSLYRLIQEKCGSERTPERFVDCSKDCTPPTRAWTDYKKIYLCVKDIVKIPGISNHMQIRDTLIHEMTHVIDHCVMGVDGYKTRSCKVKMCAEIKAMAAGGCDSKHTLSELSQCIRSTLLANYRSKCGQNPPTPQDLDQWISECIDIHNPSPLLPTALPPYPEGYTPLGLWPPSPSVCE